MPLRTYTAETAQFLKDALNLGLDEEMAKKCAKKKHFAKLYGPKAPPVSEEALGAAWALVHLGRVRGLMSSPITEPLDNVAAASGDEDDSPVSAATTTNVVTEPAQQQQQPIHSPHSNRSSLQSVEVCIVADDDDDATEDKTVRSFVQQNGLLSNNNPRAEQQPPVQPHGNSSSCLTTEVSPPRRDDKTQQSKKRRRRSPRFINSADFDTFLDCDEETTTTTTPVAPPLDNAANADLLVDLIRKVSRDPPPPPAATTGGAASTDDDCCWPPAAAAAVSSENEAVPPASSGSGMAAAESDRQQIPRMSKYRWTAKDVCIMMDGVSLLGKRWSLVSSRYLPHLRGDQIKDKWRGLVACMSTGAAMICEDCANAPIGEFRYNPDCARCGVEARIRGTGKATRHRYYLRNEDDPVEDIVQSSTSPTKPRKQKMPSVDSLPDAIDHRSGFSIQPELPPRKPWVRWTHQEDITLVDGVNSFGCGEWIKVLRHTNLLKDNKQMKDRWKNLCIYSKLGVRNGKFYLRTSADPLDEVYDPHCQQ